jgi:hypothetical protein
MKSGCNEKNSLEIVSISDKEPYQAVEIEIYTFLLSVTSLQFVHEPCILYYSMFWLLRTILQWNILHSLPNLLLMSPPLANVYNLGTTNVLLVSFNAHV